MADEKNGATQNKQIIGWAVSFLAAIVMMLFQFAILGAITDLRSDVSLLHRDTNSIADDVSSLKTGQIDLRATVVDNKTKEQSDIDKLWAAEQRREDAISRKDEASKRRGD